MVSKRIEMVLMVCCIGMSSLVFDYGCSEMRLAMDRFGGFEPQSPLKDRKVFNQEKERFRVLVLGC